MSNRIKELLDAREIAYDNRSAKTVFRNNDLYNRCVKYGVEKKIVNTELSYVIAQLEKFRKMEQEALNPNDEDLQELLTEFGQKQIELNEKLFTANESQQNAWQEYDRVTGTIKELTLLICDLDCQLEMLYSGK